MDLKGKYPVEVLYDIVEKLYFEFRQYPDFYDKFFKDYNIAQIMKIQKETLAYLFGYTSNNPGVDLAAKHKHLNIKEEDWIKFVEITTKVLNDFKLPENEIGYILSQFSQFKDQVVVN